MTINVLFSNSINTYFFFKHIDLFYIFFYIFFFYIGIKREDLFVKLTVELRIT